MRRAYETPSEPCPYCGSDCEADWCDVGIGMAQVGPYVCMACMASEASAYSDDWKARKDYDPATGWYRPGSPLDVLANQDENGKPISWQEADTRYRAECGVPARYATGPGYKPKGATQSADSEAPALLPCPFCGSAPSLVQALPSGWAVSCAGCGVGSGIRYSLMEDARPLVAEQWNRRAALAATPQPAPEQGMTRAEVGQMLDTKRHDREVLVEVINAAMDGRELVDGEPWGAEAIADALLAAGWTRGGDAAGLRRDDAG